MIEPGRNPRRPLRHRLGALALGACSAWGVSVSALAADVAVTLLGAQEVPPVTTTARGSGTIRIGDDGAISGSITTSGIMGTAAHVHSGAAGKNGPVIVPLTKGTDGSWTVANDAKLTPDQLNLFKAGDLYVNVHSAAHPDGEIRGQLK
jgi:CHRD domain